MNFQKLTKRKSTHKALIDPDRAISRLGESQEHSSNTTTRAGIWVTPCEVSDRRSSRY